MTSISPGEPGARNFPLRSVLATIGLWAERAAARFPTRAKLEARQRRAEASQPFEDVLIGEYQALERRVELAEPTYTLESSDITDAFRIAEYLYESSLKERYAEYGIPTSGDGPRIAIRAAIWGTLPLPLQERLERMVTRAGEPLPVSDDTSQLLADALNRIIRGERLSSQTDEEASV